MLAEGVWAEVMVNGEHLRLFSEHNAQGVQISVKIVTTKTWIAPSEAVDWAKAETNTETGEVIHLYFIEMLPPDDS
jgi:hypothetical protein